MRRQEAARALTGCLLKAAKCAKAKVEKVDKNKNRWKRVALGRLMPSEPLIYVSPGLEQLQIVG